MYSLPATSPSAAGKVRSFLAGQQQNDVDLLRSLRGHSLDTLQRQLAGLAVSQVSFTFSPRLSRHLFSKGLCKTVIIAVHHHNSKQSLASQ